MARGLTPSPQSTGHTGLLTLDEAAVRLGMSTRLLRDHLKAGNISYVNVGLGEHRPAYRFRPADLAAFEFERVRRCEKQSGVSTAEPTPRRGPTISLSPVIDFAARRASRPAAKPSNGSPDSGPRRRPKSRN